MKVHLQNCVMKSQIKKLFDRSFNTYDTNANIQKMAASKLANTVKGRFYKNVLELGIGSGLFTEYLIHKINFERYTAVDMSFKLLLKPKEKFKNINFINADIELLPMKTDDFNLVVCSSVLQWLEKPNQSIPGLLRHVKKGCEVYFSIFIKGTFAEMEYLCSLTNFGHVFNLKNENFYKNIFGSIELFEWNFEREDYTIYYDSVKSFLKQHKNTGATYTKNNKFAKRQSYLDFCRLYEDLFLSDSGKIPATYSILYAKGIKV